MNVQTQQECTRFDLDEMHNYFTVHDFLDWLKSIKGEIAEQPQAVQDNLAEIEALLIAQRKIQ